MQELKDNLKKEKITAEEHIQSVKNCIDCVSATVEKYGPTLKTMCEHHRGEMINSCLGDKLFRWEVDESTCETFYLNPYYIERGESNKSVSVTMALADLAASQLSEASQRTLDAFNAMNRAIANPPNQETPEVAAFRSSMYGVFVRDSRR